MAEKKELWLARDVYPDSDAEIFQDEPNPNEDGVFSGRKPFLGTVPDLNYYIPPGHKSRLTIGEPVDCRPKAESETNVAMAMLTRASERLPQGYRVGIDFGDRAGISVFGNGEVLKHDCESFDIAVEIANDHVWAKAKIPELWAWRVSRELISILRTDGDFFTIKAEQLPGLEHLHRCRIAWDENGIRLIGTPERI